LGAATGTDESLDESEEAGEGARLRNLACERGVRG